MNQFQEKNSNKNIKKYLSLASLILGIVSLIEDLSIIFVYTLYRFSPWIPQWIEDLRIVAIIYTFAWYFVFLILGVTGGTFVFPFIIPIVGLILGFLTQKERFAKFGIKLCFIGLILAIIAWYIMGTTPL